METNHQFDEITFVLKQRLKEKQYSETYVKNSYKIDLRKLQKYLEHNNTNEYTEELGAGFIKLTSKEKICSNRKNSYKRTIRHLNEIINGVEFTPISPSNRALQQFNDILTLFEEDQIKKGLRDRTVSDRKYGVYYLLSYLEANGVTELTAIRPDIIYEAYNKTNGKRLFSAVIPFFLKFIYETGFVEKDYSEIVPRTVIPKTIPSVYTEDEITTILNCVDRGTKQGKRDYAVLLLQARYGIRSCDIINLKFDNISFPGKRINFVQTKTLVPVSFPMEDSVAEALRVYIDDARPSICSELVFLRMKAPYTQMTRSGCGAIARHYFMESDVEPQGRRQGGHALRSSLASNLVNSDIAYTLVQNILGHSEIDTVQEYARIDVERLRLCALEIPPPTKTLKAFLEGEESGIE